MNAAQYCHKMLKVTECPDLFYIFIKLQFSNLNIFSRLNFIKIKIKERQFLIQTSVMQRYAPLLAC